MVAHPVKSVRPQALTTGRFALANANRPWCISADPFSPLSLPTNLTLHNPFHFLIHHNHNHQLIPFHLLIFQKHFHLSSTKTIPITFFFFTHPPRHINGNPMNLCNTSSLAHASSHSKLCKASSLVHASSSLKPLCVMAIDNIYMHSTGILAICVAMPVAIEGILAKVVNGCKWTSTHPMKIITPPQMPVCTMIPYQATNSQPWPFSPT